MAEDIQGCGVDREMRSVDHRQSDPSRSQRRPEFTVREECDVPVHRTETRDQPIGAAADLHRHLTVGTPVAKDVPVRQVRRIWRNDGRGPSQHTVPIVNTEDATFLVHIVLASDAEVRTHGGPPPVVMPIFGAHLSDNDIADLLSYVRSSWENHVPAVSAAQVKTLRAAIGEPEPGAK